MSAEESTASTSAAVPDEGVIKVEQGDKAYFVKYFLPSSSSNAGPSNRLIDLPESYFTPSPVELQMAYASQVRKREQLTEAPLLTKRLRERDEAEKNRAKAAKWPQTRIRVRFADRSQLESVFESRQTLEQVYACVRASLNEQAAKDDFTLYQTPPKKDYKPTDPQMRGKSLIDLQLTPSSLFYIRFSKPGIDNPPPLNDEVLRNAKELPVIPIEPILPPETSKPSNDKGSSSGGRTLGFGGDKGKVIPKWMKLPTK